MTSIYLAFKYLRFNKKDKNISLMIKVCLAGIIIGTFALMLTLIITNGFEKTIHEKTQGINSQAIINSPGNKLDLNLIKTILNKNLPGKIKALSGSTLKQVLLEKDDHQTLIMLKGIDPTNESLVTNLPKKIIQPNNSLFDLLTEGRVIIGHKLAQSWDLKIGDQVNLLIPENGNRTKIYLSKQVIKISGIFDIGLDEYDSGFAFCSLNYLNNIFDEKGVENISLKFFSENEEPVIKEIRNLIPELDIFSWKELYPALVSSLKLEKYVMFTIILLITLVASLNMISMLFIQIQQKRRDIAILKAMGMLKSEIRHLFLMIGMLITFTGSILGLSLAAIIGFILEKYPFIELPDVYYVSHLPARMELNLFLIVFSCTILLGFIATWIPAKRASQVNITDVLRME